jgi:predicted PurR-regulated permease PerM
VINKIPFYGQLALILISGIATLYILYIGQVIFVPLIFALFISILVNPITNFLVRKKVNRIVAILISLFIVMLAVAVLLFFISMQVSMFINTYPELKAKFDSTGENFVNWCSGKFNLEARVIKGWIRDTVNQTTHGVTASLGQTLLTVGNALVVTVLVPVYIFLILYYKHLLLEFVRKLFVVEHHARLVEVLEGTNTIIRSYLTGLLIEGAIVAVLNSVGLLALGIKYAILLGITGAILNVIPYIGGIAAIALPMIIAFVTKSPISSVWVLIVYLVIQFIDNHYLIPYVVASKVKVNALIAIVVTLIGNLIWGVAGMFLAIPITALIKVIFDHIEELKPWGFLLGDTVPPFIRLPFTKSRQANKN